MEERFSTAMNADVPRRSLTVFLGIDRKKKTENDIDAAKQYTFSSFAQFKAIMVSMGYEVYQKDENVFVKHGGKVQKEIPFSEIESLFKSGYRERTRYRQLRSLSERSTGMSVRTRRNCRRRLKNEVRQWHVVFFGKKDTPYGYMLVRPCQQDRHSWCQSPCL